MILPVLSLCQFVVSFATARKQIVSSHLLKRKKGKKKIFCCSEQVHCLGYHYDMLPIAPLHHNAIQGSED